MTTPRIPLNPDEVVYILAGNYQQAVDAARSLPQGRWRYVAESRYLFGVRGGTYTIVGTFWDRKDAGKLIAFVRMAGLEPIR